MSDTKRRYSLDVLKICATVLMVFHHYQQVIGGRFRFVNFYDGRFYYGYLVELFFLLSGLFMLSYVERILSGLSFESFFKRRWLRLAPMLAVTAAAYEVLAVIYNTAVHGSPEGNMFSLLATLTASLGISAGGAFNSPDPGVNNPAWYVCVLIICYAVLYILCRAAKKHGVSPKYLFAAMVLLGIAGRNYGFDLPFLNGYTCRGYYAFFAGVLLGGMINGRRLPLGLYAAAAAVCIGIPATIVFVPSFVNNGIEFIVTFIFYPALIILFASPLASRLLKARFIGTLGAISFNVFMWHASLLLLLKLISLKTELPFSVQSFPAMLIFTAIAYAFGAVSHLLIEKPIDKLLKRTVDGY